MSSLNQPTNSTVYVFLFVAWLASVVAGFWWFQFKDIREFSRSTSTVFFEGEQFKSQLISLVTSEHIKYAKTTVMHFWDPACSCNKFNEPHVISLMEQYSHQGVRFIIVARVTEPSERTAILAEARKRFKHDAVIKIIAVSDQQFDRLPSTPAVAVLNDKLNLTYFGPYSIGAACNVKSGAFVETTLNKMALGNVVSQINVIASGCFCAWGKQFV